MCVTIYDMIYKFVVFLPEIKYLGTYSTSRQIFEIWAFLSQMLHHPSPSPWDVDGRSPGWSCGNREDGDCEGHGAMFGEVRRGLQLLGPDGLQRSRPHLQRSVKHHLWTYLRLSTSGSKTNLPSGSKLDWCHLCPSKTSLLDFA